MAKGRPTVARPYIGRTRNIRISDEVWQKAHEKANNEDRTPTEVVRELLAGWVEGEVQVPVSNITRHRLERIASASDVDFQTAAETSLQIGARSV